MIFIPHFLFTSIYSKQNKSQFEQFKDKMEYLVEQMFLFKDPYFRQIAFESVLDTLNYLNKVSYFYLRIFIDIFYKTKDLRIQEMLLTQVINRALVEKPHPWGILFLFYNLTFKKEFIELPFYQKNSQKIEEMTKLAWDFIKID